MNITVYGRKDCVQCIWTTRHLDRLELTYNYIDVDTDPTAKHDVQAMMINLGSKTLPVVVVSNSKRTERWAGFKLEKIRGLRETGDY